MLYAVTREHGAARGCRFGNNLAQIGDVIFRQPLRYDTPWPVSLLMIVGADRGCPAVILERRVRGVEVVA